jgi:tetratricopeptide (TPR) repeat protein
VTLQPRYRTGDRIGGRYLVHQAFMGGMGEVYLCLDLEQNFPFALKTFQQRYLSNPHIRQLFAHEVGTWVALEKHPNIVRCFYMATLDNQPFMLLEWISGEEGRGTDLRSWVSRGPLDLRTALDFTIDICRGLIHANGKHPGIVHRDLKPENILIASGRVAKITDFGLASLVQQTGLKLSSDEIARHGDQKLIGASGMVGTPPYMPPEQWRGESGDARTDLYAVGCILYEMLAGSPPYQATTLDGWRQQHNEAPPPHLPMHVNLPEELNLLLVRCLAKQPGMRVTSAGALLIELEQFYEQQFGIQPRPLPAIAAFVAADYNNRGLTYHTLKQYEAAIADFTHAIELDPADVKPYFNRGLTYHALRQHEVVLADYTRAIELDPDLAEAYVSRGLTYRDLKQYETALTDLTRAIELDPDSVRAYVSRGLTYRDLKQYDMALTDFAHALARDSSYGLAYYNRGRTYFDLGHYDLALADFTRAIELDLDLTDVYNNRGLTYHALRQYEAALADFAYAISCDPADVTTYVNRANTYVTLGQHETALADYAHVLRIEPNNATLYSNRGHIYDDLGQYQAALADFTHALTLNPTYATAYFKRGRTYDTLRQYEAALADYTHAIECDPNEAKAYYNRGLTYYGLSQYERALADYTNALALDPTYAAAYYNRGVTYGAMEQHNPALVDFAEAIQLDPTLVPAYVNIGVILAKQGKFHEALPYFEQAAQLGDPEGAKFATRARQKLGMPPEEAVDPTQQAFDAFQRATSPAELQQIVARFPFMTDPQFIALVEQVIAEQVLPAHRPTFEQRVTWLRQIAGG